MSKYGIVIDVECEDDETAMDTGHIIASILAYIGSNIEVDVQKDDHTGLIYCSHGDEQIMGGSSETPG